MVDDFITVGFFFTSLLLVASACYIGVLAKWILHVKRSCVCGAAKGQIQMYPLGLKTLLDKQRAIHKKWGDETFVLMSDEAQKQMNIRDDEY